MKERIKEYIDYKQISAGELAIMLEVQRSNISHILNGRNKPGASFIEKLLLVFPDLNARWLLTGAGEMIEGAVGLNSSASVLPLKTPEEDLPKEEKAVVVRENRAEDEVSAVKTIADIENVEKMVLLFDDGTFRTYKNREG